MAYIKKIWVDVPDPSNPPNIPEGQDALARFDAENMNRIEDGIENAVKKTGGTIEGDLQIYTNSPSLILNNKNQNHSSIYKNASSDQNIDFGTVIRDSAENIESGNYLGIVLRHGLAKDGNLSDAFKLHLRNDGVEHGYKIYGEHNKPTTADVGAVPKLRNLNGRDILNVNEEGLYYCINTINMPTPSPSGYLRVEYADENYKVIYWRAYNSHDEYVNVLDNGKWRGWVEMFHSGNTAQTQIASYVGTGTCGLDNPNSLTFDFAPKVLKFLAAKNATGGNVNIDYSDEMDFPYIFCEFLTTEFVTGNHGNSWNVLGATLAKRSDDGKTIYWTCLPSRESSNEQLNTTGYTYFVLAIG